MSKPDEKKPDQNKDDVFTNIDPATLDPELQGIYKSMQADYTRKTQQIAEMKKDFDKKGTEFEGKLKNLGALEQEVNQWRNWYAYLQESGNPDNQDPGVQDPNGNLNPNNDLDDNFLLNSLNGDGNPQNAQDPRVQALQDEITSLKENIMSLSEAIKGSEDQTQRLFNYHSQLTDLKSKHDDLDQRALLDHALKNGFTDLNKAYEDLYHEDIFNAAVEARVNEELNKTRVSNLIGNSRRLIVKPSKDTPKTFTEATEQILQERAAGGTLE